MEGGESGDRVEEENSMVFVMIYWGGGGGGKKFQDKNLEHFLFSLSLSSLEEARNQQVQYLV